MTTKIRIESGQDSVHDVVVRRDVPVLGEKKMDTLATLRPGEYLETHVWDGAIITITEVD